MALSSSRLSASSYPARRSTIHGFFANARGETLEEKTLYALLKQFDFDVAKITKCILQVNDLEVIFKKYIPHIKRLLFRVNTLCTYIANADKKGLQDFLDENIKYLPLLFEFKTTVKSDRGHLYANCNAIEIAIKAGDVGRSGCELYLKSDEEPKNTRPQKLFLDSDVDANTPFRYYVNGAEQTIQRGEGEDQLKSEYFNTLKAMFRDGLMNQKIYLSTNNLTEAELKAYAELLKITHKRNHTTFIKEDGILEMFKNDYFKNESEEEFNRRCELSEETLVEAEIRKTQDREALAKVFKAISDSNRDEDCVDAISNFKQYLKDKLSRPVTTFEVDIDLFLTALTMEDEHVKNINNFGGSDDRKSALVFDHVIGPIENILSVCAQMAIAQGVYHQQEVGEQFKRSLKLRFAESSISDFLLGSGWVDDIGGCVLGGVSLAIGFQNFFRQKQVGRLMQRIEPVSQLEGVSHHQHAVIPELGYQGRIV